MSGEKIQAWHLESKPPDNRRHVMLRFHLLSPADHRVGYCSGKYFFVRGKQPARYRICAPTHWRELTEEEQ